MVKKNIAIVAGGDQSEVVVSLKSAAGIYSFLEDKKCNLYLVTIIGGKWQAEYDNEKFDIDKNDFSFTCKEGKITFDCAYITIHGIPGEDGKLQGYFDLIGMPYSCCGVLAASLTFNKYACNNYLKGFGVNIADSIRLRKGQQISDDEVIEKVGLPCFIKPNVGGSSFGVTKVVSKEQISRAITKAFEEGYEVIIERFMQGTEITCGVYKIADKTVVFPITEVVSHNEFFDYDAKYKGEVEEITPARISESVAETVRKTTSMIYDVIGAKGIIRVDYIISEDGQVNLLEVNTTPGMTPTSFIPQQVKAAGLSVGDVLSEIIEDAVMEKYK